MKKKTNLEAAFAVLSKSEGPLHYKKITEIALKDGLIEPSGKTPAASLNERVGTDINKNGKNSRFYRPKPGFYDLRSRRGPQSQGLEAPETEEKKTNKEAAIAVLTKSKEPLHYKKITEMAISEGFLERKGKTPWDTMSAILGMDIKNKNKKSDFYRPKPAHFDLMSRSFYKKPVIYIIKNIAMPDYVKVGRTSRGRLKPRLKALYRTETPFPFELFYAAEVKNAIRMERKIETVFEDKRPNKNREFYIIDPGKIKEMIEDAVVEEIKLSEQEQGLGKEYKRSLEMARKILEIRQHNKQTD